MHFCICMSLCSSSSCLTNLLCVKLQIWFLIYCCLSSFRWCVCSVLYIYNTVHNDVKQQTVVKWFFKKYLLWDFISDALLANFLVNVLILNLIFKIILVHSPWLNWGLVKQSIAMWICRQCLKFHSSIVCMCVCVCIYSHTVVRTNSCKNMVLQGCEKLRGAISYFLATRSSQWMLRQPMM